MKTIKDRQFAEINVSKLAKTLKLDTLAKQQALKNLPATQDSEFDAGQHNILSAIEGIIEKADDELNEDMATLKNNLRELEKNMDTSRGEDILNEAVQSVECINANHRDDLIQNRYLERVQLKNRQQFMSAHDIKRIAHYPESKIFHWALIIFAIVLESVANSYFFAKGSDFGLIGGTLQAMMISFVNIGTALLAGLFILPYVNHMQVFKKILAGFGLLLYFCSLLAFSLATSHYREQLEVNPLTAMSETIPHLLNTPFGVQNFDAWILFIIGILFALFALYKGYTAEDAYPGYGGIDRNYQQQLLRYEQHKNKLRTAINQCLENKLNHLHELVGLIHHNASQYNNLLAQGQQLIKRYQRYLSNIEKKCNELLTQYRETNLEFRSNPAPDYFAKIHLFTESSSKIDLQKEIELADNFTWLVTDLEGQAAESRKQLQEMNANALNMMHEFLAEVEVAADKKLENDNQTLIEKHDNIMPQSIELTEIEHVIK